MKLKFTLKASCLIFALCATVYSIYLLNSGHKLDFFNSLGMEGNAFNWCHTRVAKISDSKNQWSLYEENNKWLLKKITQPELIVDYITVEKWLANYCSLDISLYRNPDILDKHLEPYLTVEFIKGKKLIIYQLENKIFQFNEVIFTSKQTQKAFSQLKNILKI